ncbi:uncharacterized protein LOC133838914 [Drosophila sulfurigaster albostrigata]|uniref:uncharacterized protein LOC133838914 n=1 Tax=Drosophila sulfurigaster albostrigata TaxID=89887 RepID=UPI002D218CB7|nr:uncharacterized protein LOC133838914 [Drosophila sulfurigaster albostrigata]
MSRSTYPTPTLVGIKTRMNKNRKQPKQQQQQYNNDQPVERIRLCGAAKKRFHHFVRTGMNPDEARLRALQPMKFGKKPKQQAQQPIRRPPQQQDNYDEPPGSWQESIQPLMSISLPTPPSPAPSERLPVQARLGAPVLRGPAAKPVVQQPVQEETQCLNLAILPGDYPSELWSVPQLEAVQQSIIDLIQRQDADTVKPQFSGCYFRQGWLSVSCHDIDTVNWLRAMDTRLRPWEGASLQVIPETEVPFKRVFAGIFPALATSSVKYSLRLIDEQNEGLAVDDWHMLYRAQSGPLMKLIISIDSQSAEMLRQRGYYLNYGFSSVRFQPMEMSK